MLLKEGDRRLMRHGGHARTMHVVEVDVDLIDIGERRRQDNGDIAALAEGIKRVGLLEPIVVDEDQSSGHIRLVCGGRRVEAVKLLGWKTIPAQLRQDLTTEELRDIELEENENRKALNDRERARTFKSSQKLIDNAKKAAEVSGHDVQKPHGGRPSTYGKPLPEVADDLGVDERTLRRAEQHVQLAQAYPFMQGADWRQSHVLAMGETLEKLPEPERKQATGVLECARILAPVDAVQLITNMAAMKSTERSELYQLSSSEDPRDKSLALTKAAKLPPMPDPRLNSLDAALESLSRTVKPFPNDPLTPRIKAVIDELRKIRSAVKEVSYDARRNGGPVQ
jgi:hypothetical protein